MNAPTLTTDRLTLRRPQPADFPAFADHCASDRADFSTGRLHARAAWLEFAAAAGSWALHGFGAWSIEDRASGAYLGEVMLQHPPHFPERELGWTLMAPAEGRGYAAEAATAVLDWARERGDGAPVSYISPGNARSIALAKRLGAVHDPDAPLPDGETPADTTVYRHRFTQ
ncbi:GNAT family N-acetyltransferase [Oceaniglobus trochenteri]|uniref:GNAT family N-acetyltransferase n=1 Tax=Oceaniglobus trochenteri TaxID=2763260 RepID=UPI001CFF785B|nr:GNAT family N-acetyltransferase [Oceaniglobus trochenteri]